MKLSHILKEVWNIYNYKIRHSFKLKRNILYHNKNNPTSSDDPFLKYKFRIAYNDEFEEAKFN